MSLRPYQEACVQAIYEHLRGRDDNPCIVLPTAAGKTHVIVRICHDAVGQWGGRVLILAHVKELLQQAADKLRLVDFSLPVGVYSAGLGSRDTDHAVIVAGIQSVYKRACDLGPFDLIIIDEVHMCPAEGEGTYRTFLADAKVINPHVRVIGLTATPFRLKTGMICAPENILNHVCYEVSVKELIRDGYLCPLVSKAGAAKADTSGLHIRAGEFIAAETEALMDDEELVRSACDEILELTRDRHAVLVFASGVHHARHVAETLAKGGAEVATVFGETPNRERDETISAFKAGKIKYLVNVGVLTTGFDAPHVDCVVLLRPTMSPGLFYQMCGRGFRIHPDKEDCLVLDYGGNVVRHGPVDAITVSTLDRDLGDGKAPAKECPECQSLIAAGFLTCPDCGYKFPPPDRQQHDAEASTAGVLSGQVSVVEHKVLAVYYAVHFKQGADDDAPRTMRVEYEIGWHQYVREWVCFEHSGFARAKAEAWWQARSQAPVPTTAQAAVTLAREGALAEPVTITVRSVSGEPFERVIDAKLHEKPEWREVGEDEEAVPVPSWRDDYDEDEIPF